MPGRKVVDDLLAQLLLPRLGYVCASWPRRLYERIERRAASQGCQPADWLAGLLHTRAPEIDALVDAATIGHTAFFRHPEQFIELRRVLHGWAQAGRVPVRIWCVGCSSGEEAYSLVLAAHEERVPITVLGTDVNPLAIKAACAGRYVATRMSRVPGDTQQWAVPPALRSTVQFAVSSLVGPNPSLGKGPFDLIFCRNVLIYFEREDVMALLGSLAEELRPQGALVVSPADTVLPMPPNLTRCSQAGWLYLASPPSHSVRTPELATANLSARSVPTLVRGSTGPPRSSHLCRSTRAPPSSSLGRSTIPQPLSPIDQAARLLGSGQGAEAEDVLTAWLNTQPDNVGGWFLLGEALLQRGQKAQARAAFARASQCTPRPTDEIDGDTMRRTALRRAEELLD